MVGWIKQQQQSDDGCPLVYLAAARLNNNQARRARAGCAAASAASPAGGGAGSSPSRRGLSGERLRRVREGRPQRQEVRALELLACVRVHGVRVRGLRGWMCWHLCAWPCSWWLLAGRGREGHRASRRPKTLGLSPFARRFDCSVRAATAAGERSCYHLAVRSGAQGT
jgi:hypothetical protein